MKEHFSYPDNVNMVDFLSFVLREWLSNANSRLRRTLFIRPVAEEEKMEVPLFTSCDLYAHTHSWQLLVTFEKPCEVHAKTQLV